MIRIAVALFVSLLVLSAVFAANTRVYNLGDAALTTAVTNQVVTSAADSQGATQAYVDGLAGISAATIQVNFNYGSGGTTLDVFVETTLDQGSTWVQVAHATFATASAEKLFNVSGLTDKLTAVAPSTLSNDTALSGIFGDRWRAKMTSTGTYAGNSSVSVRLNAR
jgi:hypothetical protein